MAPSLGAFRICSGEEDAICGICGTVGRANASELAQMAEAMAHRGPDGQGVEVFPGSLPAGLGHRRLAIIDPSPAGAQPMSFADRWWITFNGEIYNFRELRHGLEQSGERFKTGTDTEVLLRMFAAQGLSMLDQINGIFALAIWDDRDKQLFLARDRLGVKPLYYARTGDCFAFASEVRALLPYVGTPTLNEAAIVDYLSFLWVPDPSTAFAEIHKLPPGHYAWIDRESFRVNQYWDMRFTPERRTEAEWRDAVAETVDRSVTRQLVSDVPLGAFLSGGIDSSAIVAAMAKDGQKVSTYTIGFTADDLRHEIETDDLVHARRVGERFETDYSETVLQADILDLLPKAVWHLEEPVADPAAISTYLICAEARKRMPVMLSGMGADELFAGYPRYLAFQFARALGGLPKPASRALETLISPVANPGAPGRLRGPRRNLWKFMRGAGRPAMERYLTYTRYFQPDGLSMILDAGFARSMGNHDPLQLHREYLQGAGNVDDLSRLLYLDGKTFLPCLNLTYTDKMGMAASVEVRVPLLDDELVALATRIPSRLKLKGLKRKYIFKRSQEGILPKDIIWRRKAGFGAPIRAWLGKDLAPLLEEMLSDSSIRQRGLVRPHEVARLRRENAEGRADYSLQIYALLNLELWCRTFLDRTWSFD